MGRPPRAHNNDPLRPPFLPRTLHLFHLPQHDPIRLRSPNRLHLPPHDLLLHQKINPTHLPLSRHPRPHAPHLHHLLARLPLRLRKSRPHRLHHLHPRQVLQTPARHVSTSHNLPNTLPAVQIPRRAASHCRRRHLHPLPPNKLWQNQKRRRVDYFDWK